MDGQPSYMNGFWPMAGCYFHPCNLDHGLTCNSCRQNQHRERWSAHDPLSYWACLLWETVLAVALSRYRLPKWVPPALEVRWVHGMHAGRSYTIQQQQRVCLEFRYVHARPCSHARQVWRCSTPKFTPMLSVLVPHLILFAFVCTKRLFPFLYMYLGSSQYLMLQWCTWDPSLYLGCLPVPEIFLCSSLSHVDTWNLSVYLSSFLSKYWGPFHVPGIFPCTWDLPLLVVIEEPEYKAIALSLKEYIWLKLPW